MGKGLTLSIIFKAQSLNYGEGTGNVSELKKFSRDNGIVYSYASRQTLRYDIVRLGNQIFGWQLTPVDSSRGTIQFKPEASIKEYPEIDFFGYMKTEKGEGSSNRSAVVRLSSAISMEPYLSDIEFLSNKGLADRIPGNPNIAQLEQHLSYYTYTVTIDLDKVGVDNDVKIENLEKANRVKQLLDILKILNREVKGRIENLNPLLVIGGIYEIKNPFFMGKLKLKWKGTSTNISIEPINDTLQIKFKDKIIKDDTYLGIVSGIWQNEEELKKLSVKKSTDIETIFSELSKEVEIYYASTQA